MRVIAGLPGDETRAVYRFLKAQRNPPRAATAPARPAAEATANDVERGKALVQEHGCLGCHVVEGRGGTMGPSLDGVAHRRPETFVLQQLRNPQTNSPGSLMPDLDLEDPEIAAIWAYLQAL
jgi:mono/diheme cytochrome c family protein